MSTAFSNYAPQVGDGLQILLAKAVLAKRGGGLVNLIPPGSVYSGTGSINFSGFLVTGGVYQITLGPNDTAAHQSTAMSVSNPTNPTATWTATAPLLQANGTANALVTITLYRLS